ncbi:zinc finger protein 608-like [Nasonia vitripennis]|uniref:C2H2-type domain-containing protein n=1 Tax=Nasonia vitripennis TaxID=7425 RepID=A0A7M7TED6_NASVI|nr:zinc finger protein 608-like [Nasonia vitripennis]
MGILVVNITWRGKTYVGTLLDCTRHDWAPPRFCDSPTSDFDIRTSKGTRNSMHSKLRNNGSKTRRGIYGSMAISTCSAPFISPRSDFTLKRKTRCIDEDNKNKRKVTATLLNISPSTSPVLLECPEPKCYKKYKHINGLRYHQSHAHGLMEDDDTKEGATSTSENDESIIDIPSPTTPMKSPTGSTESDSKKLKNASTSSSEHVLDESSLTLQLTFPTVHVKSTKLMDTNILDKKDTKLKNKKCSDNNVTAIISQSFPTKPRCKSEISDPNITKHSCTISLSLEESSPSNSDLLQQYELSTSTIFSKKLQKDKKNNVLQTEQVLPVHQLICQDAISVELSSQLEQDLVKEDEDQVKLIFSENKSSQNKDQRFNRIEEAVLSHSNDLFKGLSEQTLRQAKDINELSNTFSANSAQTKSVQTNLQSFADISINTKISQFKVKPTADLMPEDDRNKDSRIPKNIMFKKKTHKSPINSPQRLNAGTLNINADREDLQSPAYSDISDDTITSEAVNTCEKLVKEHGTDVKSNAQNNLIPHFSDQRRKEEFQAQILTPKALSLSPKEHSRQEKRPEINKSDENKIRAEGVKPTMETHGPPPPPTSQYAYIHPGYITSHHYGGISFDSEHHGIYRNLTPMLMSSTYTSNPYLHQLTRYAPEDLSRPPNGKAIDILHNSNQYYPLHKIHELQERAVKSPITKNQTPSTNTLLTEQSMSIKSPNDLSNSDSLGSTTAPHPPSFNIKQQSQNDSHHQQQQTSTKDSNINSLNRGSDRSPPPQRHVHTHHHTHVGLGYPILTGQYPATYGGKYD